MARYKEWTETKWEKKPMSKENFKRLSKSLERYWSIPVLNILQESNEGWLKTFAQPYIFHILQAQINNNQLTIRI